jgi:hypothetical protein
VPARRLRRQQTIGILIAAALILLFALLRAERGVVFPPGWWRW